MNFKSVLAAAVVLVSCSMAKAEFLAEPYVGYAGGNFDTTSKQTNTSTSSSSTELNVGARLGFKFPMGLWIAADPQLGLAGNMKSDAGSDPYTRTDVFGDVGFDISALRAYVGYAFLNELKSGDTKYTGGSTFKVGLSYQITPMIALSAEYHMNGYKEVEGQGVKLEVDDYFSKFKESQYFVGLAFPLSGR